MTKRKHKFTYWLVVQAMWADSYGWEDIDLIDSLGSYMLNGKEITPYTYARWIASESVMASPGYPHRIVRRRELNK